MDDEFLIAAQLQADLTAAGAEVIGPSLTLDDALALAGREPLTAAILDIQVGRQNIGPVAQLLSTRGVPFVFYTGQVDTDPIRGQWPACEVVPKPASALTLVAAIAARVRGATRSQVKRARLG